MFPEGDKVDGGIYATVFLVLAGFWWWRVVVSLSRNGVEKLKRRAVYQMVVVPFGFIGPPLAAICVLNILTSNSVRPPDPISRDVVVLVTLVIGYLFCIPLTSWIRPFSVR
jgi:hypothetical protein